MIGQLDWDGVVLPIDDVTWEAVLMTASRLKGLEVNEDFFVTYKDEEGDVINVKNDTDVIEAIRWAQEQGVPCLCLHVPFSSESDSDESWTEVDNGSPRGQVHDKASDNGLDENERQPILEEEQETPEETQPEEEQVPVVQEEEEVPSSTAEMVEDVPEEQSPVETREEEVLHQEVRHEDEVVLTLTPIPEAFTEASSSPAPVDSMRTMLDKVLEVMCTDASTIAAEPSDKEFFLTFLQKEDTIGRLAAFVGSAQVSAVVAAVAQAEQKTPGSGQKVFTTQLLRVFYQAPEVLEVLSRVPDYADVLLHVLRVLKAPKPTQEQSTNKASTNPVVSTVVHTNVTCDGCNSNANLAADSVAKGCRNAKAEIVGVRYMSAVRQDYDLCELCEATGRFQEDGPFVKIVDPSTAPELFFYCSRGSIHALLSDPDSLDATHPLTKQFVDFIRGQATQTTAQVSSATQVKTPEVNASNVAVEVEPEDVSEEERPVETGSGAVAKLEQRCKHLLKRFEAPHNKFTCDLCMTQQPARAVLYGCRVDNFDVCERCYIDNDLGLKVAPPPPTVSTVAPPQPQAKFVSDVTLSDGCAVRPGERLNKTWRVRNSGGERWPQGTRIAHVGGDAFGGPLNGVEVPLAAPGEAVNVTVPLVMPVQPGRYTSYWRLITPHPQNARFGHRFWVTVNVLPQPTPVPTFQVPPPPPVVRQYPVPVVSRPAPPPPPPMYGLPGSPPALDRPPMRPVPSAPPAQVLETDIPTEMVEVVSRITDFGFNDIDKIVRILKEVNGDVAAAIERLLEDN